MAENKNRQCSLCREVMPVDNFYVVNNIGSRRAECKKCFCRKRHQIRLQKNERAIKCFDCGFLHIPTKYDGGYCQHCRRKKGMIWKK